MPRHAWALLIVSLFVTSFVHAADKPNIIVIMADDLGYGDVSYNGTSAVETPNIDRLSNDGLRFTQGYSSASTCTPTRYSFITGEYAFRKKGTGIGGINQTALIDKGTTTIASILDDAGYATAVIGKWHLGLGAGSKPDWNGRIAPGPLEIGFDYSFLLPNTNDRAPSVYVENHHVKNLDPNDPITVSRRNPNGQPSAGKNRDLLKIDASGHNDTIHNGYGRIGFMAGGWSARWLDEELGLKWVDRSIDWIEAHQDEPFFLFFSSHDIHTPRVPHPRFRGESGLGVRGDAILQLDWSVGRLMSALDRLDLKENTLVIFCSDNGPVVIDAYQDGSRAKLDDHDINGPYRDGKYSIYEGGTRTPFVTYWPGTIEPGVSDKIVCTIDLAASMAALTGQSLDADEAPDSFNVLPALLGKPDAVGRNHLVQQPNKPGRKIAIRVGQWKLLQRGNNDALFNLADDPGEQNNLIDQRPAIARKLRARLKKIRRADESRGLTIKPVQ
jgi:arylsulfatase A